MAGSGKRGDAMKTLYWKDKKYFGKYGFKKKGIKKEINAVNIDYIENNIDKFLKDGIVDLKKLGYNKLLGNGNAVSKLKIKVESASSKAIEKIEKAGGEVVLEKKKEEAKSSE